MCKKPCASVIHMSCLLLMLLVLSSSTYGEDSSTNKVVDFNVHISESGEEYDEKIENLTMLWFPENKTCYLLPLDKKMSNPEKLIRDLETKEQGGRTDSAWITKEELNERSFLSDDLQQLCADYPIYLVKKTQDSLAATRIEKGEATGRARKRRWPCRYKCCVVRRTCLWYLRCYWLYGVYHCCWVRRCFDIFKCGYIRY